MGSWAKAITIGLSLIKGWVDAKRREDKLKKGESIKADPKRAVHRHFGSVSDNTEQLPASHTTDKPD